MIFVFILGFKFQTKDVNTFNKITLFQTEKTILKFFNYVI